eukprot:55826_1
MSSHNDGDESLSECNLNAALSLFNPINESNNILGTSQSSEIILPLKFRRYSSRSSQSIDLKSFIESDDITNQSDLWEMQSIHTSFALNDDRELTTPSNHEPSQSPKQSKLIGQKKMTLSPIIAVDRFERFKHIEAKQVPSFDIFASDQSEPELIHFAGSSSPICTFQIMYPSDQRQYFRMLIPPFYPNQTVSLLCCRKKKNMDKFRFSTDEFQMEKRNNSHYVGKMKVIKKAKNKFVTFRLTMKNKQNACLIKINVNPPNNSHMCEVQLSTNDNLIETNGIAMKGTINNFVAPKLTLSVSSSNRTVLNITDCMNCIENVLQKQPTMFKPKSNRISDVQTIDFDYPLSIFLAFAITCAVNCRHAYI